MNSKLIIITIIIVLVIVLVAWYLYAVMSGQQGNMQPNSSGTEIKGDTTADISASLNQVPDDSSMNGEVNTLNQSVQSF